MAAAKQWIHWGKAIFAGFLATLAMVIGGASIAPKMGIPAMHMGAMLAVYMDNSMGLAWLFIFFVGIVLALIYAAIQRFLPGPSAIRGAIFSLAPWLIIQLLVMGLMGQPYFGGSFPMAVESLFLWLAYGLVLGAIYNESDAKR